MLDINLLRPEKGGDPVRFTFFVSFSPLECVFFREDDDDDDE
jgi:hypothetical protein